MARSHQRGLSEVARLHLPELTDSEYAAGHAIDAVRSRPDTHFDGALHLAVSMRSFRAENVSAFVKAVLDCEIEGAREAFAKLRERYPIALTRNLAQAKSWIRQRARGTERFGLVASSEAQRLKPHAIDVRVNIDPVHWFLDDRRDTRSSLYLEDAASQFDIQGLELDWVCVNWDADLRFLGSGWGYHTFRGDRWQSVHKEDRRNYLRNAYRVLLTRARQGMVIFVPPGRRERSHAHPSLLRQNLPVPGRSGHPRAGKIGEIETVGNKMKKAANPHQHPILRKMSFEQLLATVRELADARREYGEKSANERRAAAEWAYDSGMAHDLFSSSVLAAGGGVAADTGFGSGVMALAIDPLFAPALLTVGSIEYQYKRRDAAMAMFLTLTTLPPGEPDVDAIIDKAGCFLLDQNDNPNATRLYRAATEAYPGVCEHWSSLSYCLGMAGQLIEAVSTARRALSLNENDPRVLNDLGWTLVLAGLHDEARSVLERAVALAPEGYALPQHNLRELDRRVRNTRSARGKNDGEEAP
jgi:hypothetical protein